MICPITVIEARFWLSKRSPNILRERERDLPRGSWLGASLSELHN